MLSFFLRIKPIREFIIKVDQKRIVIIISRIKNHLVKKTKILDIGCGIGLLSLAIKRKGYDLTAIDVHNISLVKNINPMIYDGKNLPFGDDAYDTALFITVLHHTPNPEHLITEATRVAKRIIIVEDIYENAFQKYATYIMDSIVNLEFFGHPHTNKDEKEWMNLFKRNKLKLIHKDRMSYWNFFLSAVYVIER